MKKILLITTVLGLFNSAYASKPQTEMKELAGLYKLGSTQVYMSKGQMCITGDSALYISQSGRIQMEYRHTEILWDNGTARNLSCKMILTGKAVVNNAGLADFNTVMAERNKTTATHILELTSVSYAVEQDTTSPACILAADALSSKSNEPVRVMLKLDNVNTIYNIHTGQKFSRVSWN